MEKTKKAVEVGLTKEEILELVINKAQVNGFNFDFFPQELFEVGIDEGVIRFPTIKEPFCEVNIMQLIFSHDFAKAFWGTGGRISWVTTTDTHWLCADCGRKKITCETDSPPKEFKDGIHAGCKNGKIWKECLQNMVLYEEPLDYLKKFL